MPIFLALLGIVNMFFGGYVAGVLLLAAALSLPFIRLRWDHKTAVAIAQLYLLAWVFYKTYQFVDYFDMWDFIF